MKVSGISLMIDLLEFRLPLGEARLDRDESLLMMLNRLLRGGYLRL